MFSSAVVVALVLGGCSREAAPPEPNPPPLPTAAAAKSIEASPPKPNRLPPIVRDWTAITEAGELAVLFTYNSTGYFVYRGETLGYEYELLRQFTTEKKLRLRAVLVRDSTMLFDQLDRGEGDLIAAQLVPGSDQKQAGFTSSLYETSPVVVQRGAQSSSAGMPPTVKKSLAREAQASESKPIEIRARLVSRVDELAGEEVHLARSSPYRRRLLELNEELTNDVHVVEVDESTDKLIQRLAEGEIGFTVAAENVAALRTGEYTNLLIKPALGPPQPVVWGVRTNAPELLAVLNEWIEAKRKSGMLNVLYKKYFLNRRAFQERVESRYLTSETGRISAYDEHFREYSRIPGWDWRLVASQAYQESRFRPDARSWVGAVGLMQIMPRTARELKVRNPRDPKQSIEAACRYLWKLDQQLSADIRNEAERIKFILASYNVGLGHVEDARRLARKNGDDANDWDDVAYWLIRKSKRNVYNDPVVRYGFARGTEPVAYVDLILDRYQHYRNFVTEHEEDNEEAPVQDEAP
jgi:membrane-bound lytic murein transglycosylase F